MAIVVNFVASKVIENHYEPSGVASFLPDIYPIITFNALFKLKVRL
ncbi:hypothetical protein [Litchfieldia alkalitelluris]|nr:hypothetical protein [Litchfieldia alkalitelluris]